ncbi:MAG: type 1 glutamine amidotransferase [Acidobacteria bacterium]|nr:type 1 glutamine amidotransferase [Acidobacteriota bacterium]MCI0629016.1 type 1 glutamine amidotransferase [Acidobacteriota bacterium]MCI0722987.1 type 1 glutamine amidotransferase [Acidobacteriota bacterium]
MRLKGKSVAIFLENLYEDTEFWYPYYRMQEEGASVTVIAPKQGSFTGKHGIPAKSDLSIHDAQADHYDALIIPGGYSPDKMRRSPEMVRFVKDMDAKGKIVAAICHAGWMLVSAGVVKGRKATSFFAIKDDLVNAGAEWIDQEVVRDENLITSRTPQDLPAFSRTIISALDPEL